MPHEAGALTQALGKEGLRGVQSSTDLGLGVEANISLAFTSQNSLQACKDLLRAPLANCFANTLQD